MKNNIYIIKLNKKNKKNYKKKNIYPNKLSI